MIRPATVSMALVALPAIAWLLLISGGASASSPPGTTASKPPWTLIWSDEFNGPNGSSPDPTHWTFDTGGNGWGNHELEYYTRRFENAHIQNGSLALTARQETYTGTDGVTRPYTSARLKTEGEFAAVYGRFEARIKIPSGQGMWPAFWMLGNNLGTVSWPACGEVDIMENIGKEPSTIHGTIHGPGYSGANGIGSSYSLPSGKFSDDYHRFAVEWEPKAIRFYVDDHLYATRTPADLPAGASWVYDHPFFIILNVAVGGSWPGNPDPSTGFPQTMLVDYVRVYQPSGSALSGARGAPRIVAGEGSFAPGP
jgi:beta-glucanase (GH16 family)